MHLASSHRRSSFIITSLKATPLDMRPIGRRLKLIYQSLSHAKYVGSHQIPRRLWIGLTFVLNKIEWFGVLWLPGQGNPH